MGDFYQNTGSLLPVMHPVKFGKENLWTYILSPLMIWGYLGRHFWICSWINIRNNALVSVINHNSDFVLYSTETLLHY